MLYFNFLSSWPSWMLAGRAAAYSAWRYSIWNKHRIMSLWELRWLRGYIEPPFLFWKTHTFNAHVEHAKQILIKFGRTLIEPGHDKTNKLACATFEDSDQPGHPPSLIRVFAVRWKVAKDPCFLHADSEDTDQIWGMPRLIWVFDGRTCLFDGFVMRWLQYRFKCYMFNHFSSFWSFWRGLSSVHL